MHAIAALPTVSAANDFAGAACPKCGALIADPKSSDYRGMGRIEHAWQCASCGETFRSTARMAGCVDFEPEAVTVAAA